MESNILGQMHQCVVQGETFKKTEKNGQLYIKVLDNYYASTSDSNLQTFEPGKYYSVGTVATFYACRNDQELYKNEVAANSVELVPRTHRRAIVYYLEKGVAGVDLTLSSVPIPYYPSAEFEDQELTIVDVGKHLERTSKPTAMEVDEEAPQSQSFIEESFEAAPIEDIPQEEAPSKDKDSSTLAPASHDLSKVLTADKIALLASKAKQVRTQKSKSENKTVLLIDQDDEKDRKLDPIDRYIKKKTRVHKTINNCMDTGTDFSFIIPMVLAIKNRENSRQAPLKPPPIPPSNSQKPGVGYSRYDQEVFEHPDTDQFQIKTGMSFHGTNLKKISDLKAAAAKPLTDPSQIPGSKRPYSAINNSAPKGQPQPRKSRTPIIIIPASGTALISMYNAMDILQDLKFVSTEEKKKMNTRRENELLIQRRKDNGQTVPYRIIDNPSRLTDDEWSRVVAVFVQGPAWQFKGWHWGGNPTTIFSNVCGFHLKFEDAKLDANVAKWSVEVLQLSKQKRHLDKAIFIRLWQKIEQFIIRNKPELRY